MKKSKQPQKIAEKKPPVLDPENRPDTIIFKEKKSLNQKVEWEEKRRNKLKETQKSFLQDCYGRKYEKFNLEKGLKASINELDTWLYNKKIGMELQVENGGLGRTKMENNLNICRVRLPELNIQQIDHILRSEEDQVSSSVRPDCRKNLVISKILKEADYNEDKFFKAMQTQIEETVSNNLIEVHFSFLFFYYYKFKKYFESFIFD